MRYLPYLLILTIILFPGKSFGQDARMPLRDALKEVSEKHKVSFNFLDSDIEGKYVTRIQPESTFQNIITQLTRDSGMLFIFVTPKSISLTKNPYAPQLHIAVDLAAVNLSEVTIDHIIARGISRQQDGSYAVRPDKFGILPGLTDADVLHTMQQIPGIISIDETISNINVRGGTHDQNLFLWNGIRMFQTGHFFGLISAFNPLPVQAIHIYKNGTPAKFGDSVSSTTVISTGADSLRTANTAMQVNMISAAVSHRARLGNNSSVLIAGRRSLSDELITPTYEKYADRIFQESRFTGGQRVSKQFYFYDFIGVFTTNFSPNSQLSATVTGIVNDLSVRGGDGSINAAAQSELSQQNYGGAVSWTTRFSDRSQLEAQGYVSYFELLSGQRGANNLQLLTQENHVLDSSGKIHYYAAPEMKVSYNAGYQYNEIGVYNADKVTAPAFSRKVREVLRTHAAVFEIGWAPKTSVGLTAGGRVNYVEQFDRLIMEPRLHFSYKPKYQWSIDILGEMKSQSISQITEKQNDFLGLEKRRWTLADGKNTMLQQSQQVSIGGSYKNHGWMLVLENFYKRVDGISTMGQSFRNQLEYTKLNGAYEVAGTEILIQKNMRYLTSWLSYSLTNNNYTFEQFDPAYFPNNFEVVHSLAWSAAYERSGLKVAVGSKWFSGKPQTQPSGFVWSQPSGSVLYNAPNSSNLGDYFQSNLSASYRWKVSDTCLFTTAFSVLNLLNTPNTIDRYYTLEGGDTEITRMDTISMERALNISVRADF